MHAAGIILAGALLTSGYAFSAKPAVWTDHAGFNV